MLTCVETPSKLSSLSYGLEQLLSTLMDESMLLRKSSKGGVCYVSVNWLNLMHLALLSLA
jgi:hypothetical protein